MITYSMARPPNATFMVAQKARLSSLYLICERNFVRLISNIRCRTICSFSYCNQCWNKILKPIYYPDFHQSLFEYFKKFLVSLFKFRFGMDIIFAGLSQACEISCGVPFEISEDTNFGRMSFNLSSLIDFFRLSFLLSRSTSKVPFLLTASINLPSFTWNLTLFFTNCAALSQRKDWESTSKWSFTVRCPLSLVFHYQRGVWISVCACNNATHHIWNKYYWNCKWLFLLKLESNVILPNTW